MGICHNTIQLKHHYRHPPERLFAAYLNPTTREIWSSPSDQTAVDIVSTDVRSGGVEETRCGMKGDLKYRTQVRYHLVRPNKLISFSEVLFEADTILSVALITFQFHEIDGDQTELVLTDQVTSYIGADGVEGHRQGLTAALVNLQRFLD
ncbi:MAG: SRPBCC domain-containing protein [Pseudomonadota bacterium]